MLPVRRPRPPRRRRGSHFEADEPGLRPARRPRAPARSSVGKRAVARRTEPPSRPVARDECASASRGQCPRRCPLRSWSPRIPESASVAQPGELDRPGADPRARRRRDRRGSRPDAGARATAARRALALRGSVTQQSTICRRSGGIPAAPRFAHRDGRVPTEPKRRSPGDSESYLEPCFFFAQAQSFPQLHLPPLSHPQLISPHALHFILTSCRHVTADGSQPLQAGCHSDAGFPVRCLHARTGEHPRAGQGAISCGEELRSSSPPAPPTS